LLAQRRGVVAIDLSGHGDSDRRPCYSLDLWAQEAIDAARAVGIIGPPVLVGHSMGGFVALRAGAIFGGQLGGVVAIDSPMRYYTPEDRAAHERRAFGPLKVYPTYEAAVARFRPVPDEGPRLDYVLRHLAATSLRQTDHGWTWKFDPGIFGRTRDTPVASAALDCRVALFRAEHGLLSPEASDIVYDKLGRVAPLVELPNTNHHVMLDEPLALVAALRTLLADWEHSLPLVPKSVSGQTLVPETDPRDGPR
jgi:pimeloyl-ACP methyl ester carboxylesterase